MLTLTPFIGLPRLLEAARILLVPRLMFLQLIFISNRYNVETFAGTITGGES